MSKRLTEKQKKDIVDGFKSGQAIDILSQKYSCTKNTIIRNLKKNIGELLFAEILKKSKSSNRKLRINKNETKDLLTPNIDNAEFKKNSNDTQTRNEKINESNFAPIESFYEIAPINYEIDNFSRKELSSVPISEVDLPKVVYMIVDKKIELEIKLLKDFPEWEFLPHDDLDRKTIEIFFDLNIARRNCNKEQKVIKVPNTDVFRIAAPILIARGITRIVCAENLISLWEGFILFLYQNQESFLE